ncbi:hypothetical protein A1O1_01739 [Capronia coronata CBS 617.96]|uniref:Uncharacterized protein n=1 Tax=Capronia coronata CBS 617.96 TaxID=1182541 RepID=W9YKF2_9EURO|nr:uncharacterized protein A1O1_01739 [Capronia coronata CBS 617.96]EXJ93347.1 hypothetical protein A1O1_01739 [Capronia coronata CBS 617.96]
MQNSVPDTRSTSSDAPNTSRDPRIREQRICTVRLEYPTKCSVQLTEVSPPRSGASQLQTALRTFVSSAIDNGIAKRKRDYLKAEAQAARAKYEHFQRSFTQFPIVVEQALEEQKKVDSDYEYIQQETRRCSEGENATSSDLVRRLFDIIVKEDEQSRLRASQVDELRKEFETLRTQTTTKLHSEKAAKDITDLTAENEALRKNVHTLQDSMSAIIRDNDALQKSLHTLQDRTKTIEDNIRDSFAIQRQESEASAKMDDSLRTGVAEIKEQVDKLSARLKPLEQGAVDLESMRKSTNLRVKSLQTRVEDAESQLNLLQKDASCYRTDTAVLRGQFSDLEARLAGYESSIETLRSESVALKDRISALQQTGTGAADRTQRLQQSLESHIREWNSLRDEISTLKLKMAATPAQGTGKDLGAQIRDLHERLDKHTSETARANRARDVLLVEEIERINHELSDKIESIQNELSEVENHTRPAVTSLSSEQSQVLESVAGLIPKLQDSESELAKLQKGLEKQTHIIQWQTHRFDNLTSETLARQMVGVLCPILPRFEEGLVKVEGDIARLWRRLEEPAPKAQDPPSDHEQRLLALKQDLSCAKTEVKSEYESLAREFRTVRDTVMAELKRLEDSHTRFDQQQATCRASNDKQMSDVEAQVAALRRALSGNDRFPASSPDTGACSPSSQDIGAHAAAAGHNASNLERSTQHKAGAVHKPNGIMKVAIEPEELDAEDIGEQASVLLESFLKKPGQATGQRPPIQTDTLLVGAGTQPRTKRRRVDSPELERQSTTGTTMPNDMVLAQPQKVQGLAKRKNKTHKT